MKARAKKKIARIRELKKVKERLEAEVVKTTVTPPPEPIPFIEPLKEGQIPASLEGLTPKQISLLEFDNRLSESEENWLRHNRRGLMS